MPMSDGDENKVVLLGRSFPSFNLDFLKATRELLWCTYRSGFEAIGDTGYCSDAGWGCMIRTGQMIVAEALGRTGRTLPQVRSPAARRPC